MTTPTGSKPQPYLLVDAHEDLCYNSLTFGRDYTLPVAEIRRREAGTLVPLWNGDATLGYPEYRRGRVAVVFATLFAVPLSKREGLWDTLAYKDVNEAHALYRRSIDFYNRLVDEHPDCFRLILTQKDLRETLAQWHSLPPEPSQTHEPGAPEPAETEPLKGPPVGLVMLMEGAEGVRSPEELEEWKELGVRLVGPAWAGNRYTGGTGMPGPLTKEGLFLLEVMADLGLGLDLSHMDEAAVLQAIDLYPGTLFATHSNALALLKNVESNRHLSDRMLQGILHRDGMVGIVPFNKFLKAGWTISDRREDVTLQHLVAQIDYVCQVAGDARHTGFGTDFDGGFGLQHIPGEIDSIIDLQKIAPLLLERGYSTGDVQAIFAQNWIDRLLKILPEES